MYVRGRRLLKRNNAGTRTAHLVWKARFFLITGAVISSNRNCVPVATFSSLGIVGSKEVKTALRN